MTQRREIEKTPRRPPAATLETARSRLMLGIFLFAGAFVFLGVRVLDVGLAEPGRGVRSEARFLGPLLPARADIADRNGDLLATNLQVQSLYADPKRVLDPNEAAELLARALPGLSEAEVREKLSLNRRFVWIKRKLTPTQVWRVNALGLPGLAFQAEEQRVYPHGRLAAHVLGFVDVDGKGIAGIENFFDDRLGDASMAGTPLALSLDIRVQHALRDELSKALEKFQAKAAAGLVLDVNTGEILALVSLPDFDPNRPGSAAPDARFNRVSKGVYELGSTLKTFTLAAALESGTVTMNSGYDATRPLRVARFLIRDDHPKARYLSVPEIYVFSSNIGAAKMAEDMGGSVQKSFLQSIGMLSPATLELAEVGRPLYPERWRPINTMTIAYGHGIAVSPLQLATATAAMVNGGFLIPATLLTQPKDARASGKVVISQGTSDKIRDLMRLVVLEGTGRQADAPGYRVGGKTGTAEKSGEGGYMRRAILSSFIGIFPIDDPRYLVFAMFDEPKGTADTYNFAGGGWVAAPVVRNVVLRTAPMLGVRPGSSRDGGLAKLASLIREED